MNMQTATILPFPNNFDRSIKRYLGTLWYNAAEHAGGVRLDDSQQTLLVPGRIITKAGFPREYDIASQRVVVTVQELAVLPGYEVLEITILTKGW